LLIINHGVTRGFAAAACSATGAGLADFTYAIVAFVAGDLLVARLQAHRTAFEIVAASILLLVASTCWLRPCVRTGQPAPHRQPEPAMNCSPPTG